MTERKPKALDLSVDGIKRIINLFEQGEKREGPVGGMTSEDYISPIRTDYDYLDKDEEGKQGKHGVVPFRQDSCIDYPTRDED